MKFFMFIAVSVFSFSSYAELNQDALNKSQALIRDSGQRAEHVKAMPQQSQEALQMLRSMGMTKDQENALFDIASDAFGGMMKDANGNTKSLQESLTKGISDPKQFLKSMESVHKNRIRDLSSQVEGFNKNERK